ncbi:hypothetical protein V1511DRAFT_105359 [Dipodascopsis uninucleata]
MKELPDKNVEPHERHHVRIRNRRLKYFETNKDDYLDIGSKSSAAQEEPELWRQLVGRFLTKEEEDKDIELKGWVGRLYQDLTKEDRIREISESSFQRNNFKVYAEGAEEVTNKEDGLEMWAYLLRMRFLEGLDSDFSYDTVDYDDKWDDLTEESRTAEDAYFDSEEPSWVSEDIADLNGNEKALTGETGEQDF